MMRQLNVLGVFAFFGASALVVLSPYAQVVSPSGALVNPAVEEANRQAESFREYLQRGSEVQLQGNLRNLGVNTLEAPDFSSLYEPNSCREGTTSSVRQWVNILPPFLCMSGNYEYWEPAAIVEVACQKGFSFLKPNFMGSEPNAKIGGQPVQPGQCGTGPNWFFEARVWASNPTQFGDRLTILGSEFWNQTGRATCSGEGTTGNRIYRWGYGIKFPFTKGPSTGPAGSYEAYISDKDPNWSQTLNPALATPISSQISATAQKNTALTQQFLAREKANDGCKVGDPNIEKCWGNDKSEPNGWATHPNRAVAAALVGYKAVRKAQSMGMMAQDIQGGLRLSMDYPFVKTPSAYAQSLGAQGASGNPRHRGSDCFVPGDGGPWWYTDGRKNTDPNQPLMPQLQTPNAAAPATIDTGVYIFTYWVKTKCTVYNSPICGSDQYDY